MSGRYDRWGGGGSSKYSSYGGGSSYDDEDGGFGSSSRSSSSRRDASYSSGGRSNTSSQSLPIGGSRGSRGSGYDRREDEDYRHQSSLPIGSRGARDDSRYADSRYDSRYDGYSGGGRGAHGDDRNMTREEYDQRMQMAHRRMEESSGNSLRVLHETLRTGIDTTEELELQAETLDRVERRLDEMDVDLDESKRHMRNIKSPFGGIANYFARRKKVSEITDPKMPSSSSAAQRRKPASKEPARPTQAVGKKTTGNRVVDDNLDEMEKMLHQLRGVGELIGEQLDDSDAQIDRVAMKMDRADVKMKGVNRDINRQLY